MTVSGFCQTKKQINITRTKIPPKIDAELNDSCWNSSQAASDFIQIEPYNGKNSMLPSEIRITYDDKALYIAAMLYDPSPDSILKELCKRDDEHANVDLFALDICPFNDGINAVGFGISAAGVQYDYKYLCGEPDFSWDAVWKSAFRIVENGWIAEFEIPYSAIRFPNKEKQIWGINFYREIRRVREMSSWSPIDIKMSGVTTQMGEITGIENIKSPPRISCTPYASAYLNKTGNETEYRYSFNGGLDLKYGLNESFTLDMTLIPDFGQVQSDDLVLNLSPFETYYGEKRPFFTEGAELFSKGGIYYSRRIGGEPRNYYDVGYSLLQGDSIIKNPNETRLINATKISGRTKYGLGIGLFNAMTSRTNAFIIDSAGNTRNYVTQPFTNYNLIVLDQSLKNNSNVSIVNSNVAMEDYLANVSGTEFQLIEKQKKYALGGNGLISQQFPENENKTSGYNYGISLSKISGNFLCGLSRSVISDTYDPNDMGFLLINNVVSNDLELSYHIYEPFWKIMNNHYNFSISYNNLFKPSKFSAVEMDLSGSATFKNYLSMWLNFDCSPIGQHDYYETRSVDRYLARAPYYNVGLGMSPDYRKKFLVDVNFNYSETYEFGQNTISYWISPRIRFSDKLLFIYNFSNTYNNNDIGWVKTSQDSMFFGARDRTTIENVVNTSYIFTNKISLSLRIRHYWSKVVYDDYYLLNERGKLEYFALQENHDINYNAFTIDLGFLWNFAPGSEISIVWKNSIYTPDNEINNIISPFMDNFENTFTFPQTNSLSIKILYYIDYSMLKK
ncbi:MAG: carbohydrate binding family 9 domain-containing protein [Bacteroidia bacterium]|nr:carbohydrate binding family 9 domain-containing protein [Bacteroidia bacterium]